MSDIDFPKTFRKEQIGFFMEKATEASTFRGPEGEAFSDDYMETIIEEVLENESDLSSFRVAAETYINKQINKEPDNPIFLRMRDSFKPIIDGIIEIEIKMYGAPKFLVSKEHNNAQAWRTDGAVPITLVDMPKDVLEEAQKYNFTHVTSTDGEEFLMPPSEEDVIYGKRRRFFDALPDVETDEDSVKMERKWLEDFEKETNYEMLDRALFICNFQDQVSMFVYKPLLAYCLHPEPRSAEMLAYETGCNVPEPETTPDQFIITASNASKRALFTALHLTGEKRDEFQGFLFEEEEWLRELGEWPKATGEESEDEGKVVFGTDYVKDKAYELAITSLIKMYAKLPLFDEDTLGFKIVFKFLHVDAKNALSHLFVAFNDLISFYEERNFTASAVTCDILKDYISELEPQQVEPTEEEVEESNKAAADERAAAANNQIYIE